MSTMIVKSTGECEAFDPAKIARTARRAGAKPELADQIAAEVSRRATDGIASNQIFEMILEILDRESPALAARYGLGQALFRLGPTGFDFEKYIAELLRAYGYETELPPILQGACVTHEVDVIARKDNHAAMIECKFRKERGIYIGIKDVMATWTRFLDLLDSSAMGKAPHLDECWLVTNTKFSEQAMQFGRCKNMTLLGWNFPKDRSLSKMIDDKTLYPITVLRALDTHTEQALVKANIMLLKQLVETDSKTLAVQTNLPEELLGRLAHEVNLIIKYT